jgi:glycosyltransferase involved in cell wall biosynthesis
MNVLVVIPVLNEQARLAKSITDLVCYFQAHARFDYEIVIADNGSTDETPHIVRSLVARFVHVRAIRLNAKGRGRALNQVWSTSKADVLSYMDSDLSTGLESFNSLIKAVAFQGFDLAIGSRLLPESHVKRCWKRELISRCYNGIIRRTFSTRFSDAQCGFKAVAQRVAGRLLPLVEDTGWFFDTELLVLAERYGYRIFDLPVTWREDSDSRVKILTTALADLRGMFRLWQRLGPKRPCEFGVSSGIASQQHNTLETDIVNESPKT